jgi:hypothetical protein
MMRAALGVMARFSAREIFTLGPAVIPFSFSGTKNALWRSIRKLRFFKALQVN